VKSSSQVVSSLLRGIALVCFCVAPAFSQIREIDSSKLPKDRAVQQVYTDLLPMDHFARTPETTWRSDVPKADVATRFHRALHTLQKAQELAPGNKELQVFAGLVARLTYNLGVEEAYDPALDILRPLAKDDLRASWFLGMLQCQSNDPVGGMQRLLQIETSSDSLPGDFWVDYATCASTTNMPIHAVRAYDIARKSPDAPPIDEQREQIAREKVKPSSVTDAYPVHQAWYTEKVAGSTRYTSNVCGESFATKLSFHISLGDVAHGTCAVTVDTQDYPSRYGPSTASLLLLTQIARPGESLDAFSKRIVEAFSHGTVKDIRKTSKIYSDEIHCPVSPCISFEIVTNKIYKAEGGGHLVAVFFQTEQPAYPGLRFETPQRLPKSPNTGKAGEPSFFRPQEVIQRFNGSLYTFVTLDANQDIYPRARVDYDDLLKSLIIDSKPPEANSP
jgi:hypothetical protein